MGPAALLLVVGLTATVAGCSSAADRSDGCTQLRAVADTGDLVRALRLHSVGVTTAADDQPGLSTVTIVSRRSVGDLLPVLRDRFDAAGYERLGEDDEGFEAEIYLARGDDVYGVARLREDPRCDGRTSLQVSVSTTMPATGTSATTG